MVWDMIRNFIDLHHPVRCALHALIADPKIKLDKARPRFQRVCEDSFHDLQIWAGIDEENKLASKKRKRGQTGNRVFIYRDSAHRSVTFSHPAHL